MRRKTIDEFIRQANKYHNHKYDYSKFIYLTDRTKGIITCHLHGDFCQSPNKHLYGQGCPKCGIETMKRLQLSDTEEFLFRARQLHGDLYDYFKVQYVNAHTPITILCAKHGEFEQTPDKHLNGRGCQDCGLEYSMNNNRWERKIYTFSDGRTEKLQGYEPWTVDYLLEQSFASSDINLSGKSRPTVYYTWNGTEKRYFPDCYISSTHTIVETKSTYFWDSQKEQNLCKISGTLAAGYNMRVIIWNNKHELVSDITYSK
jgi:hypothetical protein